jgi:large subunit ribosomal protein L10
LAITKERKKEVISEYSEWIQQSSALILTEYKGLTMKDMDELRRRVREVGGEFHVVKNTLGKLAFEQAGMKLPEGFLDGSTAIAFAFKNAPDLAKTMTEFTRLSDALKVKGGYLGHNPIAAADVKALAELPPLPVMRAQLLGMLMAPANKLARTLAEPARQLAAVLKAYSSQDAAPEAAS